MLIRNSNSLIQHSKSQFLRHSTLLRLREPMHLRLNLIRHRIQRESQILNPKRIRNQKRGKLNLPPTKRERIKIQMNRIRVQQLSPENKRVLRKLRRLLKRIKQMKSSNKKNSNKKNSNKKSSNKKSSNKKSSNSSHRHSLSNSNSNKIVNHNCSLKQLNRKNHNKMLKIKTIIRLSNHPQHKTALHKIISAILMLLILYLHQI